MSRPYKPAGSPGLIPYLAVSNPDKAVTFYQEAFGFKLTSEPMRHDNNIIHAEMQLNEAKIMFAGEGAWGSEHQDPQTTQSPSPIGLFVYVEDVDNFFENAKKNGAEVIDSPEDAFWGDRMCRLRDPFGYKWSFATNVKDFDPTAMPFK